MNKLTIDDLKKASEIWSTDGKTIFTENELFHLDSNIIYSEIFAINKNKERKSLFKSLKHPILDYSYHDNDEMIPKVEKKYWELNKGD